MLRAILAEHSPGSTRTRTELEERFLALCREHRLPNPEVNAEVEGFEVDFFFPNAKLGSSRRTARRTAARSCQREGGGSARAPGAELSRRKASQPRKQGRSLGGPRRAPMTQDGDALQAAQPAPAQKAS